MRNSLLARLNLDDLSMIRPLLSSVALANGSIIDTHYSLNRYVFFVDSGFFSVLLAVGDREMELGLVGCEGLIGLPAVLGSPIASQRAVARHDSTAWRIDAAELRKLIAALRTMDGMVLRYMQAAAAQVALTSFANVHLTLSQRLARWLLMADDRVGGEPLVITHNILSLALGAQRPGVTNALHLLAGEGAIRARPRAIDIVDRAKLIALTDGAYGPAEEAADHLLHAR